MFNFNYQMFYKKRVQRWNYDIYFPNKSLCKVEYIVKLFITVDETHALFLK